MRARAPCTTVCCMQPPCAGCVVRCITMPLSSTRYKCTGRPAPPAGPPRRPLVPLLHMKALCCYYVCS